jgi:predicted metallopeptidase
MQVSKLTLEKGVVATLNSGGELLHSVHVLFHVPATQTGCCPDERYRRIAIESTTPLLMYMSIKTDDKYRKCKRRYIEYADKILDPLVPRFEQMALENQFKAVVSYISHIPLLTLPGDEILMSFYAHKPFTVKVRVDW